TVANHVPSMGPRLARRGIGRSACIGFSLPYLQWVHGSLAVVSKDASRASEEEVKPSMGPRLARRGIGSVADLQTAGDDAFNGSTARSPWYRHFAFAGW